MTTWESIDSWEELRKHLPERRLAVFFALCEHGSMTGRELNAHLQSQSAHKRLSELSDMGLVQKGESRRCRVTGRKSAVWGALEGIRPDPRTRRFDGCPETRCLWPIRLKKIVKPPTYKELQEQVRELQLEVSRLRLEAERRWGSEGEDSRQVTMGFYRER